MAPNRTILASDARRLLAAADRMEAGDQRSAVGLYLKAVEAGSPEAQINLANLYDEGDGVREDFVRARYWYKQGIRQGVGEGAYNLGVSYWNRGSTRWAKHWLLVAKSMGVEDADELLKEVGHH